MVVVGIAWCEEYDHLYKCNDWQWRRHDGIKRYKTCTKVQVILETLRFMLVDVKCKLMERLLMVFLNLGDEHHVSYDRGDEADGHYEGHDAGAHVGLERAQTGHETTGM